MKIVIGTLVLAAGAACAAPSGFWRFDDGKVGEAAGAVAPAGLAGVFEKGTAPSGDGDVIAKRLWDGATFAEVMPDNAASLRFICGDVSGSGAPVGGQVTVPGSEALTRPESFTLEAFVKVARLTSRHALIASKRRNGQTGASWSLSVTPAGTLGVRFDTQAGMQSSGEGFNQCLGTTAALSDGAWHHVALTYDLASQAAVLYADYVKCGGGVTKGPLIYDAGDLVFGRGLDGWLDEVRLTPAVLHPEQFLRPSPFFSDMKPRVVSIALLDQTPTRVQSALKPELKRLGTLIPKSVKAIETPMWSLGCETLDRDLANWDAYKAYLEPLGIRRIRLQGGWGRTEKVKGVYDFGWLDHIVDDAHERGFTVCLETSYGNKLYEKNAAGGPGGLLPEGEETLAAWDKWVEAMVRHYAPKGVKEWMMYNEPNLRKENTVEKTAAFNIRTAEVIRRADPQAKVAAFVLSGLNLNMIEGLLTQVNAQGKAGLFDWAVYHGYGANPDSLSSNMTELCVLLKRLAPQLRPWQGEAGCASEEVQYALSGIDWTEYSHAKWNARRMLSDFGHGIESSVFTITDLSYSKDFISRYGLIKTNPDNSIIKVKSAYYMVQNVVSVFNGALERRPDYSLTAACEKELTWYAFRDKQTGLDVVALWDGTEIPSNGSDLLTAQITVKDGHFKEPVWVDLITGNVYEIPAERMISDGATVAFKEIPVYDGPAALTSKSLVAYVPAREKKSKAGAKAGAKMTLAAKASEIKWETHLLPGTQQPAPAVLICASPGADVVGLVTWLNAQEVHALVLFDGGASAAQALRQIRARSAEWQVKADAVGVLGVGANVPKAVAAAGDADFAVLLDAERDAVMQGVTDAKRDAVFVGKAEGWEKPLAAWLEKRKGKVF